MTSGLDAEAKLAALDVTVVAIGRQVAGIESALERGLAAVNLQVAAIARDVNAGQRTPWGVIWSAAGVALVFLTTIGGLMYYPIQSAAIDNKQAIAQLATATTAALADVVSKTVSRQEMDWRAARAAEDRQNALDALSIIRDQQVPRKEYDERWRGADQRFIDVQRQIDSISTAFGGSYSLRDALLDMKGKIDRLEAEKHP